VRTWAAMLASRLVRWSWAPLTIPSCAKGVDGEPETTCWARGSNESFCTPASTPVRFCTSAWNSPKVADAGTSMRDRPEAVTKRTMTLAMAPGWPYRGMGTRSGRAS